MTRKTSEYTPEELERAKRIREIQEALRKRNDLGDDMYGRRQGYGQQNYGQQGYGQQSRPGGYSYGNSQTPPYQQGQAGGYYGNSQTPPYQAPRNRQQYQQPARPGSRPRPNVRSDYKPPSGAGAQQAGNASYEAYLRSKQEGAEDTKYSKKERRKAEKKAAKLQRKEERKADKRAEKAAAKEAARNASGSYGRDRGSAKPGGVKRRIKRFVIAIVVIAALLACAACGMLVWMSGNFDRVKTSDDEFAISAAAAKGLKGYRNIAILGSDARMDESLDGSRTDAIIILSINKKNGDIRMISVMRDSYLKLEAPSGNLILDKITHAHAYGGAVDTCAALNRSLDLNISEFVVFDWKSVADAVDTLGGITINVKKNEISDMNKYGPETAENVGTKYHKIKASGEQELDGTQAVTYCRIRKSSGGDTSRAGRYKKVLAAVMKKMAVSPHKMPALATKVLPQIRTNMSTTNVLSFAVRAPGYDIKKNIGWPFNYWGGLIDGVWYAVPQTLQSNVEKLHNDAFEQENYQISDTCAEINDEIINYTGIY